jgi:D-apionolactonase
MAKTKTSRAIKLFGTEVPDGKRRELKAGHLTALLDNGALRYIRYRGVEVLRGIAFLVRDRNWGTYAPAIEAPEVRQAKDGFTVSYMATCHDKDQAIRYGVEVAAKADGTLSFAAAGTPLTDFVTNRTGFVILHPLEGVAGKSVAVVHTDGNHTKRNFPKLISPGQPIFEIASLTHMVVPGVTAAVFMEGNKFEMEDHRNWMDASYKTYVCSLLDPWPYTLEKGKSFTQCVSLTVAGTPARATARRRSDVIQLTVGGLKNRLPLIGAGVPMQEAEAALSKADLVAAARPAHLVCQIDGREGDQAEAARAFRQLKERTGIPVTLEIVLPARKQAGREVADVAAALKEGGLKPDSVIITQAHDLKSFQPNTPRPWGPTYEDMAAAARAAFPGVPLGGGMLSFFTELNRKRPPQGLFDFITHTVCPIVHAADDISVMETLESLPWIFASTRAIIGKSPYHLGPSGIACRDNPYGAAAAANPGNGRVCLSDMDPRQRGLFGAAWNLGLLAAAARGGLNRISLGSVTGPRGVIRNSDAVYPAYHVLAGLAPASGTRRIEALSSAPSSVTALAHRSKSGPVLWLANLTAAPRKVKVGGFAGAAHLHLLGEGTFESMAKDANYLFKDGEKLKRVSSLELGPYAVARIASA